MLNAERIDNIRYADDTVVFADSLIDLQELINGASEEQKINVPFSAWSAWC